MSKQVEVPESAAREAAEAIFEQRFGRRPWWRFGYLDRTDARRLGEIHRELDLVLPSLYKHFSDRLLEAVDEITRQAGLASAPHDYCMGDETKERAWLLGRDDTIEHVAGDIRVVVEDFLRATSTPEVDRG
jgi:hypothetical protein